MSNYINNPEKVTYIGNIDYRNKMIKFGIKAKDRTRHTYIIGKTGMGKSTLLENLAIQDIQNDEGMAFLDPHGGTAEKLLDFIPEHRKKDVIYFAPFDTDYPLALNVLEKVDPDKRHLVSNGLMAAFKKLFKDQFSARMEYILNNIVLALLENDDETLLGVNRMLTDKEYRKKIVSNVKDPSVKAFWEEEYAKYTDKFAAEAAPAIQNKVGQFISNPLIRNIIGQKKTSFDLREIMDQRKILIINLSKGKMGEGNANLIGSLLITKIYLAAMSRADVDPYQLNSLPPFYFYVDEFQNFANESFASILSEARKYQLALTVAHQYIEQMTDEVRAAIFGNVGTMITYRVGATDAEIFEKEFSPVFLTDNFVNLAAYQMYLRLMIDGVGSRPFSAQALPPIQKPDSSFAPEMIEFSRENFGKAKDLVEIEIKKWYEQGKVQDTSSKTQDTRFKMQDEQDSRYKNQDFGAAKPAYAKAAARPSQPKDLEDKKFETINKPASSPYLPPEKIIQKPVSVNQDSENNQKDFSKDLSSKSFTNTDSQSRPRVRSRPDSRKENLQNSLRDVDLQQVREENLQNKTEVTENKNALKDALQKAISQNKKNIFSEKNSQSQKDNDTESENKKENLKNLNQNPINQSTDKIKTEEIDEDILRRLME